MNHKFVVHKKCEIIHCPICDGGLALCEICECWEGSLATECPMTSCTLEIQDKIYAGKLDFINDNWVCS